MKLSTPLKVIGYVRVSTDKQELSPVAQQQQMEAWCKEHQATLIKIFFDTITGTSQISERVGLSEALGAIKTQKANVLLVCKRDRLARDPTVIGSVIVYLNKHDARLISVAGEGTQDNDPASQLLGSIIDVVARFEQQLTSSRTRNAMRSNAAQNRLATTPPYGWKRASADSQDRQLEKNQEEQEIVAHIQRLRHEGAQIDAIVQWLTTHGYTNRKGKKFHRVQVSRLIRVNPNLAAGRVIQRSNTNGTPTRSA